LEDLQPHQHQQQVSALVANGLGVRAISRKLQLPVGSAHKLVKAVKASLAFAERVNSGAFLDRAAALGRALGYWVCNRVLPNSRAAMPLRNCPAMARSVHKGIIRARRARAKVQSARLGDGNFAKCAVAGVKTPSRRFAVPMYVRYVS
jgi:hypothetical protein